MTLLRPTFRLAALPALMLFAASGQAAAADLDIKRC